MSCYHLGDGKFEWFYSFSSDGGDGVEGELATLGHGRELFEFVGIGDVGFGGDEDGGLGREARVEAVQLGGDDLEVFDGIGPVRGVGDVDQMDDDAGALDVTEELDAEACAEMRAFDEAGEIGYGEGFGVWVFADLDDAEVGFERGEGVVGDLGLGGGEARDERRLADVRVADEARVS